MLEISEEEYEKTKLESTIFNSCVEVLKKSEEVRIQQFTRILSNHESEKLNKIKEYNVDDIASFLTNTNQDSSKHTIRIENDMVWLEK